MGAGEDRVGEAIPDHGCGRPPATRRAQRPPARVGQTVGMAHLAPLLAASAGTTVRRALVVLLAAAVVLAIGVAVGTWRARREWLRITSTPIDTDELSEMPTPMVLARADSGLLNAEHEKLAVAAVRLDELDHPQRAAYLLHALRRAPHHAAELLPRLATLPTSELEAQVHLVRALPDALREAVTERRTRGPADVG